MNRAERVELEKLYSQAKHMHLSKFKFHNNFITLARAKEMLSKSKGK